jgi:hypothetical protein
VEDLRVHVTYLPVTVPMEQRTPFVIQAMSLDDGSKLSDLDRRMAQRLGFSAEDVAKANNLKT